ncbi:MAG: glycosyltransferase family 4 protein [Candidatus Cloacimonetes bacterium]|nr:glycosyltransferase family 4 protein [Candidatus Cloacimonadota bacterium]
MKLAIYAPYDYSKVGGVERYVLSFIQACPSDIEVTLISDKGSDDISCPVLATDQVHTQSFDLCISHAIFGGQELPKSQKYIHIFHGTILGNLFVRPWLWLHPKFWTWLWMEYQSTKNKDGIIAVSDWARSEIRQMGFKGPVTMIHSGGGFEKDRFEGDKQLSPSFIFCGRFTDKVKRFQMILDGLRLARKTNPEIKLYVLGGDVSIQDEGLVSLGALPWNKVREVYKKYSFQINASFYEGCSLSMAEGQFLGNTVNLSTPVGGNLNQLQDTKSGYFFQNSQELAKLMVDLSTDQDKYQQMQNEIDQSKLVPSWEQVVSDTLNFYHSLI